MKSMVLLFALTVAPIATLGDAPAPSLSPSPVPIMQNMSSQEQMFKFFQRRAAQAREVLHKFRVAMLDALTPDHRAAIGAAIGAYALAASPNKSALIESINDILTQAERDRIAAAMTAYLAEQEAMRPAFEADFAREFPELAKTAQPNETQGPLPEVLPAQSSQILANWLLGSQPRPIETMSFAQLQALTPFSWSGPESQQWRQQMRSEMLDALSHSNRSEIATAIGRYAVSTDPNDPALANAIDAMLSAAERHHILKAYSDFAVAQKTAFAKSQAQFETMRTQMPAGAAMPFPVQAMSAEPVDAGSVLMKSLITGPTITAGVDRVGSGSP
jgi:hypothetical protein